MAGKKQGKGKGKLRITAERANPSIVNLKVGGVAWRGSIGWRRDSTSSVWSTGELLHQPGEKWDAWYERAYELVPEAGSAVEQMVALVSGCQWVSAEGDDATLRLLEEFVAQPEIMLGEAMRQGIWNYYTYGRCYLQAHQAKLGDWGSVDAVKVPNPTTFRTCRDNKIDYDALAEAAVKAKKQLWSITSPTAHTGKIIGHIQEASDTDAPLIFKPDDLIFIPRSTPKYPNGVGILRNQYRKCVNIAGTEEMLARATRIYSNPPWYFEVGNADVPCPANATGQAMLDFVKTQLGALTEAGQVESITQIVLPYWAKFVLPRFEVPIAPAIIEHHYKQLNWLLTGIGVPPAIMSAEGFRATAQEALRFVEDRVHPIRERFQSEFTAHIILPYLTAKHNGQPPGGKWHMPEWSWRDITPGDLDRMRETLTLACGGPFMSINESRSAHGGLAPLPEDRWYTGKNTAGVADPEELLTRRQEIEREHGKPIKQVIEDLMGPKEKPKIGHLAAARQLGIASATLYSWRREVGHWP